MLTEKQLGNLKRGNVSVDAGLTKERVAEDYKAASAADKKAIRELAKAPNFNSVVAKSGTISAKYAAVMADVLGVSPYYYTGESEDKKPFTGEILTGFLMKHSDKKPAAAKSKASVKKPAAKKAVKPVVKKPAVKKAAKPVVKKAAEKPAVKKAAPSKAKAAPSKAKAAPAKVTKAAPAKPKAPRKNAASAKAAKPVTAKPKAVTSVKITDDDVIVLVEALAIQSKFNGEAKDKYNKIKDILTK